MFKEYDVIVVGAGHAGCEAAAAAANLGSSVLLITMNMETIAQMSCNPAMGGVAKGQIVREIDAMGGYSGIISDKTTLQFRMLNLSKALRCGAQEHRMIEKDLQRNGACVGANTKCRLLARYGQQPTHKKQYRCWC